MSTAACPAPAQLSEAYSFPARWDFARSPAATGRLRMTYGIALGSKRCRLLSISVISPTAESVWIPSGNGPSENGSTVAAGSSVNSVGVKRRTRLITIPPPYIREQSWAGRYRTPSWTKGVPAGLEDRMSAFTGFNACGSHGPSRLRACHTNNGMFSPTSRSVQVSHHRLSCRKTVGSRAATLDTSVPILYHGTGDWN